MSTPEFNPADHPRDPGGQFAIKIGEEAGGTDVLGGEPAADDDYTYSVAVGKWREHHDRIVAKIDAGEPTFEDEEADLAADAAELLVQLDDELQREKTVEEMVKETNQLNRRIAHKVIGEIGDEFKETTDKDLAYLDLVADDSQSTGAGAVHVDQFTATDGTTYAGDPRHNENAYLDLLSVTSDKSSKLNLDHVSDMEGVELHRISEGMAHDHSWSHRVDVSRLR